MHKKEMLASLFFLRVPENQCRDPQILWLWVEHRCLRQTMFVAFPFQGEFKTEYGESTVYNSLDT